MNTSARWLQITIGTLALIGIIGIVIAGVLGSLAIIRAARKTSARGETASPILLEPGSSPIPPPPPGNAMPPPAAEAAAAKKIAVYNSQPQPAPSGTPDLTVKIINTGILKDGLEDRFEAAPILRPGEYPAVRFEITNIGSAISESWEFTVSLPAANGFFSSPSQRRLSPGDSAIFTIGFRPIPAASVMDKAVAVITIDPKNTMRDANRPNDHAPAIFTIGR